MEENNLESLSSLSLLQGGIKNIINTTVNTGIHCIVIVTRRDPLVFTRTSGEMYSSYHKLSRI